jgi:hypothetical protein
MNDESVKIARPTLILAKIESVGSVIAIGPRAIGDHVGVVAAFDDVKPVIGQSRRNATKYVSRNICRYLAARVRKPDTSGLLTTQYRNHLVFYAHSLFPSTKRR